MALTDKEIADLLKFQYPNGIRYSTEKKIEAKRLRTEENMPIPQIAIKLGIAKSTAFAWIGNISHKKPIIIRSRIKLGPVAQRSEHRSYKPSVPVQFRAGLSPITGLRCHFDTNIGYIRVYLPNHPERNTRGWVYEHRVVAEQKIGRRLEPNEVVHHRNRIRHDK